MGGELGPESGLLLHNAASTVGGRVIIGESHTCTDKSGHLPVTNDTGYKPFLMLLTIMDFHIILRNILSFLSIYLFKYILINIFNNDQYFSKLLLDIITY